ncbi:hypothetical protein CTI12_AA136760 [Artemisia annua]|uniref:Replication protein A 70 kDa DNA-binding subunit B/D first OB fold domain-containing protein n=1 Tax=Artemisia annua TaxID=35608 RepID=A0A2U1PLZ2_ARTAN|nr:hypothetical protein CTI12_AA136760 [Artemisia annua]
MSLTVETGAPSKDMAAAVVPARELAYFTDLHPTDNSKFIQVRVYRKWTAMKVPSRIPTAFSCILLDKKGSAIQANADLKDKDRFERDLQLNCVYKIQGFGFDKTDNWGKTLDNDFTLCFGKYTQIDLLQDNEYPYHYFNFAAYNELSARLEKKNPILTDGTGNATITCFTPQTDGLIKDVNSLLQEVEDKDPTKIPAAILALQNTRHIFQFRFAKPIPKGPTTFVLQKIMDNPPTALPEAPAGPSSPPTPPTEHEADEHTTPPPTTPVATQETPAETQTEIPSVLREGSSSSVRKELFTVSAHEETHPVPKKHKKE